MTARQATSPDRSFPANDRHGILPCQMALTCTGSPP